MLAKRIRLVNYGPIDRLDISMPFDGDAPKPVIFVGPNGSGKSILQSHIVNGLLIAQGIVYPAAREVEEGKAFKFRSSSYIKSGSDCYYARVDYEDGLFVEEMHLIRPKVEFPSNPEVIDEEDIKQLWEMIGPEDNDRLNTNLGAKVSQLSTVFKESCVLYFPSDRFEEPAWLNHQNLNAKAKFMESKALVGDTTRRIISVSPLIDNQIWFFEVAFDSRVFEAMQRLESVRFEGTDEPSRVAIHLGYLGSASRFVETAIDLIGKILGIENRLQVSIGYRGRRTVSVMEEDRIIVPNLFQLSTGETSLINLFLTILRDFDLSGANFKSRSDIRGVVIIDEIDLHLHAVQQHEVLPILIRMFPGVQFIVTTHSPLFLLGMRKTFGEEGFAIYELPHGQQISPEEFSEFGSAYQSFSTSRKFRDDLQGAIKEAQKPIVFVEGDIDNKYIQRAAELLDRQGTLSEIQLRDGNGFGGLNSISKHFDSRLAEVTPQEIVLLYDCDESKCSTKGNVHKRHIPLQESHPLEKGIENLFCRDTLQRARNAKSAFIDVSPEYTRTTRGEPETVPEEWSINDDEKKNLCNWLCEHGTAQDFEHFQEVFDLLEELLGPRPEAETMLEDYQDRNTVAQ